MVNIRLSYEPLYGKLLGVALHSRIGELALVAALSGQRRSTITEEMPPPLLVVEVVSPGKINEDRDYRYKRSEYAARGIPEYWIVDPAQAKVTVLTLVDGWYEAEELGVDSILQSPQFSGLSLSVAQVLSPKSS